MGDLGSALFGAAAGFIQLGLLIFVIVAVVGGRSEEDPDGVRPASIYYHGAQFVAVFTVLFGAFVTLASLLNLTLDNGDDYFGPGANHDGDWSAAVRALIVAGVAAGLYFFHDRRRQEREWGPPGVRVRRTYLYTVSFVAVLAATAATIVGLFAVWDLIAPGVTGAGPRSESLIAFIDAAFLAVGASGLVRYHLREAEPNAPAPSPAPPPPTPAAAPAPAKKVAAKKTAAKKAAR